MISPLKQQRHYFVLKINIKKSFKNPILFSTKPREFKAVLPLSLLPLLSRWGPHLRVLLLLQTKYIPNDMGLIVRAQVNLLEPARAKHRLSCRTPNLQTTQR